MKASGNKQDLFAGTKTNSTANRPSAQLSPTQPGLSAPRANHHFSWNSSPVLSADDRESLDALVGQAMLNTRICDRLIGSRDERLLSEFGLSEAARRWVSGIEAVTLKDFAQALLAAFQPGFNGGRAVAA